MRPGPGIGLPMPRALHLTLVGDIPGGGHELVRTGLKDGLPSQPAISAVELFRSRRPLESSHLNRLDARNMGQLVTHQPHPHSVKNDFYRVGYTQESDSFLN